MEIFARSQELSRLNVDANMHNHSCMTINKTTRLKAKRNSARRGSKHNSRCFYCGELGHWKCNLPIHLEDRKACNIKKSIFYIHVLDVYLTNAQSRSWFLIQVPTRTYVTQNRTYR